MKLEDYSLNAAEEESVLSCMNDQNPYMLINSLQVSPGVSKGENIMSLISKLVVNGKDSRTGRQVELVLVLKRILQSEERRALLHCDAAFQNEAAFYSKVLPCLRTLSPTKLAFPSCLLATDTLIVLQHLGQDGFKMASRKQGLDLQHCILVLQELSKYNAVSYAMKHNNPEEFKKISSVPKEVFITKDFKMFDEFVDQNITMAVEATKDLESSTKSKLNAIKGNGLNILTDLVSPNEPMAVITHGDFWNNNLLFRYSPEDPKTPVEVCFLDLQGCRYASPALDILYFLFSSSRPGVLRQNFRLLLATYHQALQDNLKMLAPFAPEITLSAIMDEIRHHALYGLVMSLMVLPTVTMGDIDIDFDALTEEIVKSQEFQEKAQREFITPEYKIRVKEIISVFVDNQLI